ncbi:hypothetical protein L596_030824 [Steinernema carpocapsae]|uniref:Uncharacterized protein n=1 Tax=Steinernema carpocapsae TaxID=34508 RepID=A0A4U5LN71_STECR|nr:hypothetical protein L596_030824 [Steinernema carpocapsae]
MKPVLVFLLLVPVFETHPSIMVENRANIKNILIPRQITQRARLESEFSSAAKAALGIETRVRTAFYDSYGNTMDQAVIRIPPPQARTSFKQKSAVYSNPLPLAINSDIVSSTFKPSKYSSNKSKNVLIVFRRSEAGLI